MSDKEEKKPFLETVTGAVGGGNLSVDNLKKPAGLDEQVVGGGVRHETESDLSTELYGGVTFDGDYKLGIHSEYNFFEKDKEETTDSEASGQIASQSGDHGDNDLKLKAVVDIMYASRYGGIVASAALQAETLLMDGRMKAKGLIGYVQAPHEQDTGVYGQVELDMRLSQERDCDDFLDKGCLSNVFTATLSPAGQVQLENQMLHDTNVLGVPFRAGPSISREADGSTGVGFAVRAEF
tara:strand:+ start:378794 stop:379507 length:714 start_codon:yes stop_codon:yes gene_type:complete